MADSKKVKFFSNKGLTKPLSGCIINTENEREVKTMREQLIDRMIRIYGFEHDVVIEFARMCEKDCFTDRDLEVIVECHEANPVGFDDEDED